MIQIAATAVNAKLYNADRDTRLAVSNLLSYLVEGAEHSDAYRMGRWDGRSTFYDFKRDVFPAGFVNMVYSFLVKRGLQVQIVRKPLPAPKGPIAPKVDSFPEDPRYAYQQDTVDRLVRHGQMVARVATGGGKSRIAKLAYARIRRPTMFLTTRSVLMYQMRDAFADMGLTVGVIGDGEYTPRTGVNVAMVQTLQARLAPVDRKDPDYRRKAHMRQKTIDFLSMLELVILEEAHEAGGNGYFEILSLCKSSYYRLALTATPFMRDDDEANMRLMAVSGPIGITITEKQLIDSGILATPYFKFIDTPSYPGTLFRNTSWPRCYTLGVVTNEIRNGIIVAEALKAVQHSLTCMILVQRTAHGKELNQALRAKGVRSVFIHGKHEQEQRQSALTAVKEGKIQVIIGSTILDVGVDVPAVGMVILAGAGKAEVGLRQRIGRGLRAKKDGPNVAFIVDFTDSKNSYLHTHARTRQLIIESTPGFRERILPSGRDFPWSMFDTKAA